MRFVKKNRPLDITIIAVLMIVFGFAEITTGFTHNFLGLISTASVTLSTFGSSGVGALYAIGGLLLLTMKKLGAELALVCLVIVILGRVLLVLTGLYPTNSFLQTFSIIIGTTLAIIFFIYILLKWKVFK